MVADSSRSVLKQRRDAILDELAAVVEVMADPERGGDRAAYERLIDELEQVCRLLVDAADLGVERVLVR